LHVSEIIFIVNLQPLGMPPFLLPGLGPGLGPRLMPRDWLLLSGLLQVDMIPRQMTTEPALDSSGNQHATVHP